MVVRNESSSEDVVGDMNYRRIAQNNVSVEDLYQIGRTELPYSQSYRNSIVTDLHVSSDNKNHICDRETEEEGTKMGRLIAITM